MWLRAMQAGQAQGAVSPRVACPWWGQSRWTLRSPGCCSWVMSCGSAGEAGLLPVTLCGWHHSGGKQETCGMRLGGSTAPKSLQVSIPILSHKLHPCLCKHRPLRAQSCKAIPALWLMCAAGSSVLGAGLFVKPSPRAQAGPGSSTACCPRPWDKVIWCRTCICTGAPEWLWGLCLGSDQVWGTLASFWRFSPLHLSSQTAT